MILCLIDQNGETIHPSCWELVTLARQVADDTGLPAAAVVIGHAARPLIPQLAGFGFSTIYLVKHDDLDDYAPAAWAQSLVNLIEETAVQIVLAPGSARGNEVLAHVAARLDLPLAVNCTAVVTSPNFQITRLRWGGSLLEEATLSGSPKLLTIAPHIFTAATERDGADPIVIEFTPTLSEKEFRVQVTSRQPSETNGISLSEARVVVGGGRGVGSAEGFALLEELAQLLDGAVGGSRVATNLGWRPHADQIGQTGTRIAPDLYIACGISGAIQHWVGCKGARHILAINTDGEAPMVTRADTAVIGDLHEIIPALIAEIKRLRK